MAETINQGRRARRATVILTAEIEHEGQSIPVTLSNLSPGGALIVGELIPAEGSRVVFRRNDICVASRVAWVEAGHAGLEFDEPLQFEDLLRHVPQPHTVVRQQFRRPRLK